MAKKKKKHIEDNKAYYEVFDRKLELMKRDPLVEGFDKQFHEWRLKVKQANLKQRGLHNNLFYDPVLNDLQQKIEQKWNLKIYHLEDKWSVHPDEDVKLVHELVSDARNRAALYDYV